MADFSAVGVYSIGASLAVQVNVLLNISVFETLMPMANRVYETEGAAALRALKARFLLPMTYAAVAVSVLLACFGGDVIVALSGSAKAASGPVFAMLGALYALQCVLLVAGYGLLLERRSSKVMTLMAIDPARRRDRRGGAVLPDAAGDGGVRPLVARRDAHATEDGRLPARRGGRLAGDAPAHAGMS